MSGKKNKDQEPEKLEDNIFNTREFGDFVVDIPLKTEDYNILNKDPEIQFKMGLFIIKYQLDNKSQGETEIFKPKELV